MRKATADDTPAVADMIRARCSWLERRGLPSLREDADDLAPATSRSSESASDAPAETGLWVFVLGDMTIFGAFFLVFLVENRADRPGFARAASQLLTAVGAINTFVLLLSSYLVVLAVHARRSDAAKRAGVLVLGALGCAATFAVLKVVEYGSELAAGNTPRSGLFFTFYFVLTGVHLLHVLIGSVLLSIWWRRTRSGRPWRVVRRYVEGSAVYWHMVDLLWIVIFTLLYLVVRS